MDWIPARILSLIGQHPFYPSPRQMIPKHKDTVHPFRGSLVKYAHLTDYGLKLWVLKGLWRSCGTLWMQPRSDSITGTLHYAMLLSMASWWCWMVCYWIYVSNSVSSLSANQSVTQCGFLAKSFEAVKIFCSKIRQEYLNFCPYWSWALFELKRGRKRITFQLSWRTKHFWQFSY